MIDLTNKKMLKEWQKIEAAGIFDSLEEFAKYYYENGEKSCFRIITNDPWSKENFFFGTYQELLEFYKNELPKRSIGKKTYALTVLDVFKDNKDGRERWYAKCKCDCGRTTIKLFESIKDGNARSCGCNKGRPKTKKDPTLYDVFSEIIDSYWDFDKNDVNPKDVLLSSQEEFWWKGYKESFKMPIHYLLRLDSGTSFPEQTISFFLKQNNIEVINRHLINSNNKNYELDLFLPQLNVGIEYDGVFWHSSKTIKDLEKNKVIENAGITFVRIREQGLESTGIKNGAEIFIDGSITNPSLANCINKLFSYLESISKFTFCKIRPEDINKNKIAIKKQYSLSYKTDNIANSWLSECWSNKNTVEPYLVSTDSSEKYYFECEEGAEFYCSPNSLFSKSKNRSSAKGIFCSLHLCHRDNKIAKMLKSKVLNVTFFYERFCAIEFMIENRYDTSFQSLETSVHSVLSNKEYYSYGKFKSTIKSFECMAIENPLPVPSKCIDKYNHCFAKNLDFTPFSNKRYIATLELKKNQLQQSKFDILAVFNLIDQSNCSFKVCISVQKDGDFIDKNSKVFAKSTFDAICQEQNVMEYTLSESATYRLLYEIK